MKKAAHPIATHSGFAGSQLICRVRPCEKPSSHITVLEDEGRVEVGPEKSQPGEPLRFDRLLKSASSKNQEELFEIFKPSVFQCIRGRSCTVVAFGGPQSGKSYTLSGFFTHGQLHGLAPRAIQTVADALESQSEAAAVEASFFEIADDVVYDLLSSERNEVAVHELAERPHCAMDPGLSFHRCDKSTGFCRLLDTYFTGLEQRKKGTHTCFQMAFVRADGGQRSFLRFVEMAWTRGLLSQRHVSGTDASREHAVGVLEQVLQVKITGGISAPAQYRASPLAVLLKPCIEGSNSLLFIFCLRLEHIQLTNLAVAAPLIARLFTLLTMVREAAGRAGSNGVHGADLPTLGGSHYLVPPPPEETGVHADPVAGAKPPQTIQKDNGTVAASMFEDDSIIISHCAHLLDAKMRSAEVLQTEASQAASMIQDVLAVLGEIVRTRQALGIGPDERETNLKLVCDRINRSLQRTFYERQRLDDDIQILKQYSGTGIVAPIFDTYGSPEEDSRKHFMAAGEHSADDVLIATVPGKNSAYPQKTFPSSCLHAIGAKPAHARSPSPPVPHLHLASLPQENIVLPGMPNADVCSARSSSACSSEVSQCQQLRGHPNSYFLGRATSIAVCSGMHPLACTPPVPAAPPGSCAASVGQGSSVSGSAACGHFAPTGLPLAAFGQQNRHSGTTSPPVPRQGDLMASAMSLTANAINPVPSHCSTTVQAVSRPRSIAMMRCSSVGTLPGKPVAGPCVTTSPTLCARLHQSPLRGSFVVPATIVSGVSTAEDSFVGVRSGVSSPAPPIQHQLPARNRIAATASPPPSRTPIASCPAQPGLKSRPTPPRASTPALGQRPAVPAMGTVARMTTPVLKTRGGCHYTHLAAGGGRGRGNPSPERRLATGMTSPVRATRMTSPIRADFSHVSTFGKCQVAQPSIHYIHDA